MTTASACCCSRNNTGRNERGSSSRTGECFPGLIKIRNDLFPGSDPSFSLPPPPLLPPPSASTASSGTGIPISIQGSEPRSSPRLNLLPAVSRSSPVTTPPFLRRPSAHPRVPSVFDAPIGRTMGQSYLLVVASSRPSTLAPPLPPRLPSSTRAPVATTNRFSALAPLVFLLPTPPTFCLFPFGYSREFSFIPVDRLVRDNEAGGTVIDFSNHVAP